LFECPRNINVTNSEEAIEGLKQIIDQNNNYDPSEIGILISSGIDSASIIKFLPKKSHAFFATYTDFEKDDEINIVKNYCKICDIELHIIYVSWKNYEENMDFLMSVKKSPIHPCEIPVYLCCEKAKNIGIKIIYSGWGCDTYFGGMDKLMSTDLTTKNFKKRYEYCPRINKNSHVDKCYEKYIHDDKIDVYAFLADNYHLMTLRSFYYIPEIFGLIHIAPWGYIGLKNGLDFEKIKSEPKYLVKEVFKKLYLNDDINITNKIPFQRPTDIYMKLHYDDFEYVKEINKYKDDNSKIFTGQQKWMVYALNRFLKNILRL
jgi:hypothetical protein